MCTVSENQPVTFTIGCSSRNSLLTQGHDHNIDSSKNDAKITCKDHSVWSYMYSELTRGYILEHDEAKYHEKRERIYNVFKIPVELEKFMTYGFFQCLDAFLYVFTFLPIRFLMALIKLLVCGSASSCLSSRGRILEPAQICDLLKGLILILGYLIMQHVDLSMMYHLIRGQAIIKLYLFFNMLEVADRLFSSFGQDTLDSLFWTATEPRERSRHHVGVIPHLLLAIVYVGIHGVLVIFQASTLNVAFNSHNKALLTIMMSNNFVELKGSVFKKFEKNNLFQMSCSDVRERFHFIVLLAIVCIRNLTEFSWNLDYLLKLIPDVLMVLLAEVLVDWIKHAFITKFNEIPATVFKEYKISLAYDMISIREKKSHSDHMDLVSRRMGFIPLPLAVVLAHVVSQSLKIRTWADVGLGFTFYLCLVTLKVLNSIILLGKACKYTEGAKQSSKHPKKSDSMESDVSSSSLPSRPSPPSSPTQQKSHKRRLSDSNMAFTSGVEELSKSCLKRTRSLGHKMNVRFGEAKVIEHIAPCPTISPSPSGSAIAAAQTVASEDLKTSLLEALSKIELPQTDKTFSDMEGDRTLARSVSITSKMLLSNSTVSLQSVGLNEDYIKDTHQEEVKESENELKQRKPPPKPLNEIDRYTMCSNRII